MLLWTPIAFTALVAAAAYWNLRRRLGRARDLNYETSAASPTTA